MRKLFNKSKFDKVKAYFKEADPLLFAKAPQSLRFNYFYSTTIAAPGIGFNSVSPAVTPFVLPYPCLLKRISASGTNATAAGGTRIIRSENIRVSLVDAIPTVGNFTFDRLFQYGLNAAGWGDGNTISFNMGDNSALNLESLSILVNTFHIILQAQETVAIGDIVNVDLILEFVRL